LLQAGIGTGGHGSFQVFMPGGRAIAIMGQNEENGGLFRSRMREGSR
jgi:hypothetical protein